MALYPDVLKNAHAELDTVVGPTRLPDFDDKTSLTYVNAIIREASRWLPVLPLGVPHCTMEEERRLSRRNSEKSRANCGIECAGVATGAATSFDSQFLHVVSADEASRSAQTESHLMTRA